MTVTDSGMQIFTMMLVHVSSDVGACIFKENVPIKTFNMSFESSQNKQQYGTQTTCIEARGKVMVISNVVQLF